MKKNPPSRGSRPGSSDGFRSRGSKGPAKGDPGRARGTRSHGSVQTPRKRKGDNAKRQRGTASNRKGWIWGTHAVMAVLSNPSRTVHELVMTEGAERRLAHHTFPLPARIVEPRDLDRMLPPGATHQGLAVHAAPLEWPTLPTLAQDTDLVLVLDQVTDPHNLGAMFRLASAFGAGALILQDRHAPPLDGATAKVATGCVETVPCLQVTNIADTLTELHDLGFQSIGLAGETELDLKEALASPGNYAIVMGAEGSGLRPRVAKTCDRLARIPMQSTKAPGNAESLNVATAAAIALYETRRG